MKRFNAAWIVLMTAVFSFSFQGCVHAPKVILPTYDEVLVFELPYDLVYLRAMEALENVDGWEVEETEKEKGIIRVRNVQFKKVGDMDVQLANILIQRRDRRKTSVSFAEDSQHTLGGDKLLQAISEFVGQEL